MVAASPSFFRSPSSAVCGTAARRITPNPQTLNSKTKFHFQKYFSKTPCNFQKDLLLYTSHMDDDFHQTDRGIAQLIEQRSPKP